MKRLIYLFTFLFSTIFFAQQGINYKAIVKDNSGNIVANDLIQVQFAILQGTTSVYEETHSPTTDTNGLVILNIGNGTPISGDFSTIDWAADNHFLNVQINIGGGLVDLGTTQFMRVPYAHHSETANIANNVSGLETVTESSTTGWRLIGKDPNNYGDIGINAVDVSNSSTSSSTHGAIGNTTFASGFNTEASGAYAAAMGFTTIAEGQSSFSVGENTYAVGTASFAFGNQSEAGGIASIAGGFSSESIGNYSTALGFDVNADAFRSTAFGSFNVGGGSAAVWQATDPIFEIGNGQSINNKSNALTILKNGTITAPSLDISEITDDKALITKEYIDNEVDGGQGLERLDEGNGIGWRLKTRDSNDYGNIGENAIDISTNLITSTTRGATGQFSFASGNSTTASGVVATALGNTTLASGANSFSAGFITEATGSISSAFGQNTKADAQVSFVIGRFNLGGGNPTSWIDTDPIFEVGNGSDDSNRNNALTIYKNGFHEIDGNNSGLRVNYRDTGLLVQGIGAGTAGDGIIINNAEDGIIVSNPIGDGIKVISAGGVGGDFFGDEAGVIAKAFSNTAPDLILSATNSSLLSGIVSSDPDFQDSDIVIRSYDQVIVDIDYDSNDNSAFFVRSGGNQTILTLTEPGNLTISGTLIQNSDRRLKKDIENLNYGLKEVLQLQPKAYHWKNMAQDKKSLGLIAQEVKPIISEIVNVQDDEQKTLGISYTELIPVLIKAIQEQQDIIINQRSLLKAERQINNKQDKQIMVLIKHMQAIENIQSK